MKNAIEITNNSSNLALQEFCDMEQLYRLIDNWSRSTGMYAAVVDNEGNRKRGRLRLPARFQRFFNTDKDCPTDKFSAEFSRDRLSLRDRMPMKSSEKQPSSA